MERIIKNASLWFWRHVLFNLFLLFLWWIYVPDLSFGFIEKIVSHSSFLAPLFPMFRFRNTYYCLCLQLLHFKTSYQLRSTSQYLTSLIYLQFLHPSRSTMAAHTLLPLHEMNHNDEEVFGMDFSDLGDFLGDVDFQPDFNASTVSMSAQPVSPESSMTMTNGAVSALELPFPPSLHPDEMASRISPASSVADEGSVDASESSDDKDVPSTVVTASSEKNGVTKAVTNVQAKKQRRRYVYFYLSFFLFSFLALTCYWLIFLLFPALSSSERNREHAKRCRSRKKNYLKSLEDSVVELKSENEQLRRLMMMKFSREELTSFLKDRPTTTAADRFTAALMKKPDVAPLSNATDYLHSLREECGEVWVL